jgi:hypothetical protein
MEEAGDANMGARVRYAATLDTHAVSEEGEVALTGGERENVPLQVLIPVAGGLHTVGVIYGVVTYRSYESREVVVAPVSLAAIVVP